jgi:hypothetical protein
MRAKFTLLLPEEPGNSCRFMRTETAEEVSAQVTGGTTPPRR